MSCRVALLADNIHINRKNFNLLLSFLSARGAIMRTPEAYPLPLTANGFYEDRSFDRAVKNRQLFFSSLSASELLDTKSRGINLFNVCRAETLSRLLPINRRPEEPLPAERVSLIEWMLNSGADILHRTMAAAEVWINFWWRFFEASKVDYILVFSGSPIYARSLLEVSKFFSGRTFVLESFFTGTHFYCEERFSPIANNSDLRLNGLHAGLGCHENRAAFETERNIMAQTMKNRVNKNVRQPLSDGRRLFSGSKKNLLILGQVINDFSLIEYKSIGLNSLNFYLRVMEEALSMTDMNIIFKAHPWERQKFNVKGPHTFNFLAERYAGNRRVMILEQFSIHDLFRQSDCVITLNSQSGIEAAWEGGFRPLEAGGAFWGGKGFSADIDLSDQEGVRKYLNNAKAWTLALDEFEKLEIFLINSLRKWLVPEQGDAGKILESIFYELPKSRPAAAKPPAVKPLAEIKPEQSSSRRKLKKFFSNPRLFLRDSRYKILRILGKRL